MPSSPLGNTHDRMTSGLAYHHRPLIAYMVRRRRTWHAILTLDKIYGRTMSGVEFHHILWTAHMVERRQAWHAIITHGQHTRSKELGRGILSSLLNRTHFRTTSNVASLHGPWVAHYRTVSRKACLPSSPMENISDRTISGVTFHNCLWKALSDGRYCAWNAIIAL